MHLKKVLWREEKKVMFVCLKLDPGRKQVEVGLSLLSPLLSQEVLRGQAAVLTFSHI